MATLSVLDLLPELWKMMRAHLGSHYDARDRVALQRTCRRAYSLDPGLILAPAWEKEYRDNNEDYFGIVQLQRRVHILKALKAITASGLFEKSYFIDPWSFAMNEGFEGDDQRWWLSIRWKLGNKVYACLDYDHDEDIQRRKNPAVWRLELEVDSPPTILHITAWTLPDLFRKCPTLCFGISEELMIARKHELVDLFVHSEYRLYL